MVATWLIHTWEYSFIFDVHYAYVIWLIHILHGSFMFDMTHSYLTRLIHVTRLIHLTWRIHIWDDSTTRGITPSYLTWLVHMGHASFIPDKTHSCVMAHSYLRWLNHTWHGSFIVQSCKVRCWICTLSCFGKSRTMHVRHELRSQCFTNCKYKSTLFPVLISY